MLLMRLLNIHKVVKLRVQYNYPKRKGHITLNKPQKSQVLIKHIKKSL